MSQTHDGTDRGSPYSTPSWVKMFGIIALILVLLVGVLLITGLGGEHGPGRHIPSNAAGDTSFTELEMNSDNVGGHTPPIKHSTQQP